MLTDRIIMKSISSKIFEQFYISDVSYTNMYKNMNFHNQFYLSFYSIKYL